MKLNDLRIIENMKNSKFIGALWPMNLHKKITTLTNEWTLECMTERGEK